MQSNDFASLAAVHLPASSRLLASACCPDKDLLVLITRLGGHDRMSLWKMHGSKTWEVDLSTDSERIVAVAWSPDGQTIAVAHDPPSISLHSIQDGHSERTVSIPVSDLPTSQLTAIWWFRQEKPQQSPIPDIFRRNNIITGSAHSVLRTLPLLDPLRDGTQQVTATDLFAFQGSQTTARRAVPIPAVIKGWPTLHPDPLAASINVPNTTRTVENGIMDEVDDINLDSILAVADRSGRIACFLDGMYPLGFINLGNSTTIVSLFKDPKQPILLAHPVHDGSATSLIPTHISLSLLEDRKVRDFAKLSTTARELCWYILRIEQEMRAAWVGSETAPGARELGPRWINAYEKKQLDQYGLQPSAILDLTTLLVTDRATDALADYLGSGHQMSERGIQKWDSAVTEALVKLRDYSEKRLVPACQRLHLVLGEVRGWSMLPTLYSAFGITHNTVNQCLAMLKQAVILASWLAAAARREHLRFKEFMLWLRYATVILNPTTETAAPIRHDILEVNQYLMSGLQHSAIDRWFAGPLPDFQPTDFSLLSNRASIPDTMRDCGMVLQHEPKSIYDGTSKIPPDGFNETGTPVNRNISALIGALAKCCREVFDRPSGAATRAATISPGFGSATVPASPLSISHPNNLIRERTQVDKDGYYIEYLVIHAPSTSTPEHRSYVTFVRQRYGHESSHVELAVYESYLRPGEEGSEHGFGVDLLAMEFFDDETIVIIYRSEGDAYIATLSYNELEYQKIKLVKGYVTRESVIGSAIQGLGEEEAGSRYLPIKHSRGLKGCKTGAVSLAVNGRVGRRVACVLDNKGTTLETFDLEGDEGVDGDTTLDEER
ncbi:anaphase-promoting complex, cyclosome, subunit 4-domain-containing protein [Rhodocollybia butyracea]|uniref:Anaphase-promoting complex subunit 4 n=1 Tax=Rhodocollybia butyracea TaxID=206335 RepID=A0A9P5PTG3_9AGAR|nr:anaphase-promoting complex, cyclosome, subunit 4-domain-containing protein [Rhodocollybia butyracea]